MISKQRLEELIEQGATIYYFCGGKIHKMNFLEIKPNKFYDDGFNYYINSELGYKGKLLIFCEYKYLYEFETEEDAKWELEMTATRTETLKLPTWEEIAKEVVYEKNIYGYDRKNYVLIIENYGNEPTIEICCLNDYSGIFEAYEKPLTKENYIKACKLCLKLFKGKEV